MSSIIPAPLQPYAKLVMALAGAIVTTLLAAFPEPPRWLTIVSALVTALAVYVVPNAAAPEPEPESSTHPLDGA